MADLSEKVTQEQQQYIRAQWADAQDAERFRYMDPRVEAQVQVNSSSFSPMWFSDGMCRCLQSSRGQSQGVC